MNSFVLANERVKGVNQKEFHFERWVGFRSLSCLPILLPACLLLIPLRDFLLLLNSGMNEFPFLPESHAQTQRR